MIVTITYKFVLVAIGVGIAVFGRGFLHQYLEGILPVFYLGLGLNIFCVTFMTVLVFHPDLARNFLVKGLKILERRTFSAKEKADLRNWKILWIPTERLQRILRDIRELSLM